MEIPKIIHYCWFGGTPLPKSAQKCIASWRKYLPDYEIKEWNESNFDVNIIPYTAQAYQAKKYAYVSDYARFYLLYKYGGLYFDVDVEIISSLDDIIAKGPFMGCESSVLEGESPILLGVNPGLGLGSFAKHEFLKEQLSIYDKMDFFEENKGKTVLEYKTVVSYTTELLVKYGLQNIAGVQKVYGFYIYPKDYFNPLEHINQLTITSNTRSKHHYAGTWLPLKYRIIKKMVHFIGPKAYACYLNLINRLK